VGRIWCYDVRKIAGRSCQIQNAGLLLLLLTVMQSLDSLRQVRETATKDVRFEVFIAVTMKNGIFLDATPCGSCKN
jgi:adenylylsulfate kinase-like enzyme